MVHNVIMSHSAAPPPFIYPNTSRYGHWTWGLTFFWSGGPVTWRLVAATGQQLPGHRRADIQAMFDICCAILREAAHLQTTCTSSFSLNPAVLKGVLPSIVQHRLISLACLQKGGYWWCWDVGNWTNWTGAGDTIAAGPGWAGLGWVSGTAATESREKNAMNSYSQTPPRPAPPRPAECSFDSFSAGDKSWVFSEYCRWRHGPGSGSGDGGMQGQGWCGHVTQCRARTLSRLLTCTAAAGPGGGAGPSGHFSLDLHSYFKLLDEGC